MASAVDRGWLWSARVAALMSIVLVSAPALVLQPVLLPMAWPFWAPYLLILGLLRAKTLTAGLACATGTGATAFVLSLLYLFFAMGKVHAPAAKTALAGSIAPFALAQAVLAASAFKARAMAAAGPQDRRTHAGGLALGAVSILIPFAYALWTERRIVGDATQQAEREQRAAAQMSSEARVVQLVKQMALCAAAYEAEHPELGFPASQGLMGPEGQKCVDASLARGETSGYSVTYMPGEPDAAGRIQTYAVDARPIRYAPPTRAGFFADESGVVRVTREDRAATAADPPW